MCSFAECGHVYSHLSKFVGEQYTKWFQDGAQANFNFISSTTNHLFCLFASPGSTDQNVAEAFGLMTKLCTDTSP